jgi:hypothetical protein
MTVHISPTTKDTYKEDDSRVIESTSPYATLIINDICIALLVLDINSLTLLLPLTKKKGWLVL